jgi:hypothetical protein
MMEMRFYAEKYVKGLLDDEQMKAFETAMESDEELALVVTHFQSIQKTADGMLEDDLLNRVSKVTADLRDTGESPSIESTSIKSKRNKYWLPLFILMLCAFMFWMIFNSPSSDRQDIEMEEPPYLIERNESNENIIFENKDEQDGEQVKDKSTDPDPPVDKQEKKDDKQVNTQQLIAQYFTPYRHPSLEPTLRGDAEGTIRDELEKAYWDEDYALVLRQWELLDADQQKNPTLQFLYVNALLDANRMTEAESTLLELSKNKNRRFDQSEEWYLALIYTYQGELDKATSLLEKIKDSNSHQYQVDARRLLASF